MSEDRTKKVSNTWETDHLRQMKQHLLPEERGNQMQHIILFWFNNFEISSLTHKKSWFYLLLIFLPPVDEIIEA